MSDLVVELRDRDGSIVALADVRQTVVASETGAYVSGLCGVVPHRLGGAPMLVTAHRAHTSRWVEYSRPTSVRPGTRYSVIVNKVGEIA